MEGKLTGPITADENKALAKLKELLIAKKVEFNASKFNDYYLVRFLRARKLEPGKAFEMFSNFLKWRADNKIDDLEVKLNN